MKNGNPWMWSQCVWLMNRWTVRVRPRNSCARERPSSRMPVPASKIRMSWPDRSSTQAVFPPYSVVEGPGAAIEPRVPQKVTPSRGAARSAFRRSTRATSSSG